MNKKELILYPLFSMPVIAVDVNIDNKKILKFLKKTKLGIQPHGINSYMSHSVKILDDKIYLFNISHIFKKEPMSCSTYDVFENNHNIYSCEEWTITPKENTVLLFPSNLMHRVAKNLSNKNRYSLAFNINPIGTFYKNCDTEITYE